MSVLVLAEHDHASIKPSTLNAVTAALKLDADVHVLVAGETAGEAAKQAAAIAGVKKVLLADAPAFSHHLPENVAPLLVRLADSYSHIVAPATTYGKNVLPRVAGLKDVQQISDVIEIVDASTFKRPVYAGNAIATVQSSDALKLLTVRTTGFDAADASGGSAPVETVSDSSESGLSLFVSQELTKSARPELTAAKIVVSGGRGIGSQENFKIIEDMADKLGAAVGASRAAVDSGYAPNDYQVGQTGKVVAPQLYVAVGISGAIQHLAGMKDSKVIVAINKDAEAPIFQIADYGLVADLFEAVPELTKKL
jgi:electron transfer flavoprotein alpha subunit